MRDLYAEINATVHKEKNILRMTMIPEKVNNLFTEEMDNVEDITCSSFLRAVVTSYLRGKGRLGVKPRAWERKLAEKLEQVAIDEKKSELEIAGRKTLYLEQKSVRAMKIYAEENDTTMSEIVRELVHDWMLKPRKLKWHKPDKTCASACCFYAGEWEILTELAKQRGMTAPAVIRCLMYDYLESAKKHEADDWKYRTGDIDSVMARVYARSGKGIGDGVSEKQESQETE